MPPQAQFKPLAAWLGNRTSGPIQLDELRAVQATLVEGTTGLCATEHENRFFKATLWRSANGRESLRLHLWQGAVGEDSNIHGHGWRFRSLLLAGSLTQEHYTRDEGRLIPRFRYRAGSHARPERDGWRQLRLASREIFHAGDIYELPASALHRIASRSGCGTASLVFTEDRDDAADIEVYRETPQRAVEAGVIDIGASLRALFARSAETRH